MTYTRLGRIHSRSAPPGLGSAVPVGVGRHGRQAKLFLPWTCRTRWGIAAPRAVAAGCPQTRPPTSLQNTRAATWMRSCWSVRARLWIFEGAPASFLCEASGHAVRPRQRTAACKAWCDLWKGGGDLPLRLRDHEIVSQRLGGGPLELDGSDLALNVIQAPTQQRVSCTPRGAYAFTAWQGRDLCYSTHGKLSSCLTHGPLSATKYRKVIQPVTVYACGLLHIPLLISPASAHRCSLMMALPLRTHDLSGWSLHGRPLGWSLSR